MTPVKFEFFKPDGLPLANYTFEIKAAKSGFLESADGIVMPDTISATTDELGIVTVLLAPSSSLYYVKVINNDVEYEEDDCKPAIYYKFYVPDVATVVRVQDLIMDPPPSTVAWDEAAMLLIMDAKIVSVAAAAAALQSAADAAASAESMEDNATAAKASELAAKASEVAAAGSQLSATNSATTATTQAGISTTKAAEASASAAAALASQSSATISESNALSYRNTASTAATNAANSATAAGNSATAAASSQSAASISAAGALASKNAAGVSEVNAKTSETNAANSAGQAANKQPLNAKLTALSQAVMAANTMFLFTGAETGGPISFTPKAQSFVAQTSEAAMRTFLGLGAAAQGNFAFSHVNYTDNDVMRIGDAGVGVGLVTNPYGLTNIDSGANLPGDWSFSIDHTAGTIPFSYGLVKIWFVSPTHMCQLAQSYTSNELAFRGVLGGANWSNWVYVAKAGANSNITSLSGLTTPLSVAQGGTGTNNLTTNNVPEGGNYYYTEARVRAAALTGLSLATNSPILASDSLLTGIGKAQAQISSKAAAGVNNDITALNGLTTAIPVSKGGTGANSQSGARDNLGLGTVAIESTVPVTKGGTGATTATSARANLGLGTSATLNVGVVAGNIQTVSAPPPMVGHSGYIEPGSHFITYDSNPGATYTQYAPKENAYFAGMRAQFPFQNCAMDLVAEVVTETASMDLNFRTITSSGFPGPWRKIYHDGNTTRAADGTLKAI